MIRDWIDRLFGKTETKTERPPKPDPKERSCTYYVCETKAWWPGSDGPMKVAYKDQYGNPRREVWFVDYEYGVGEDNLPYVEGIEIEKAFENITFEDPTVVVEVKETYIARPYWSESKYRDDEWRFKKDKGTVKRERVK